MAHLSQNVCPVVMCRCESSSSMSLPAGVNFLYEDVYNLEAICRDSQGGILKFKLYEVPGKPTLCWAPSPGVVAVSSIPVKLIQKKPAAAKLIQKKPAAAKVRVIGKTSLKDTWGMHEPQKWWHRPLLTFTASVRAPYMAHPLIVCV